MTCYFEGSYHGWTRLTPVSPQASQCGILRQDDIGTGFSSSTAVSAVCDSAVKEQAEKEHLGHQYST